MIAIKLLTDTAAIPVNAILIYIVAKMDDRIELVCVCDVAINVKTAKRIIGARNYGQLDWRIAAGGRGSCAPDRRSDIA